jgi:hypothetical protein
MYPKVEKVMSYYLATIKRIETSMTVSGAASQPAALDLCLRHPELTNPTPAAAVTNTPAEIPQGEKRSREYPNTRAHAKKVKV